MLLSRSIPTRKSTAVIERVTVQESNGPTLYMMANSVSALVALLQMGALELHPFGSSAPKLECPDRIIFDFDPDDDVSWETLVEAVHLLKTLLEELGLQTFIKTTGGKGLHVVVPIRPALGWDDIKSFTKAVAELMVKSFPDRFVATVTKSKRHGKIFVDYLRNAEGATAVAAYSLRARANAPVATPIAWDELSQDVRRDHFNVKNVPQRLEKDEERPVGGFLRREAVGDQSDDEEGRAAVGHFDEKRSFRRSETIVTARADVKKLPVFCVELRHEPGFPREILLHRFAIAGVPVVDEEEVVDALAVGRRHRRRRLRWHSPRLSTRRARLRAASRP